MLQRINRYLRAIAFCTAFSVLPGSLMAAANWAEIEKLQEVGKFADIPVKLDAIIQQARQHGDNKDWRDALLLRASLGLSTNAEEALDALIAAPWPQDQDSQLLLNLHLGAYIHQYIQQRSWEIGQREKIDTDKPLTTKQKTLAQLSADAHVAFSKAYRLSLQRSDLMSRINTLPTKQAPGYFTNGNYPKNVRGTVRDVVTYLWIDALKNTADWSPQQSAEVADFNVQELLTSPYQAAINPTDPQANPLKVAVKLASDLEQFHRANHQPEAALEAFRVKVEVIAGARSNPRDLQLIIQALRSKISQQQNGGNNLPWLNKLRLDLAEYINRTDSSTKQIQRLAVIKPCLKSDKQRRLYKLCDAVASDITYPVLSMTAMRSDGLNKRSVQLRYKNIDKVYFRAWKLSPQQALAGERSHQTLMDAALRNNDKGQHQWSAALENKQDYQFHKYFPTLPMTQKGYWLIGASTDESFSEQSVRVWSGMNVTSLVVDVENKNDNLDVTTYLGESGQVAANVELELWQHSYNASIKPKRVAVARSGKDGRASFKRQPQQLYKVVAKHRGDYVSSGVINRNYGYGGGHERSKSALIFTDRAIYRPAQKIQWKVVAYHGNTDTGKYQVFPNSKGWVKLLDANGKLVKQLAVKTNRFGSASGEFTADAGRLLGRWHIHTSWGGYQAVRVEEYKRPTFEAKLLQPKQGLRLNHLAKITGSVRYYFGDKVSSGTAKWRIERRLIHPRGYYMKSEAVASGESALNANGEFVITFKPTGAKEDAMTGKPLVYRYIVSADVTDSGGETRSVSRSFSVAAVNIAASISGDANFGIAGQPMQFSVKRHDLGGEGFAGTGFWELFRLKQPQHAIMAADLPVRDISKAQQKYTTAGDRKHPRWQPSEGLEERSKYWPLGAKVAQGSLKHGTDGLAKITFKAPVPGVYRLRYTTKDQWGQVFHKQKPVVVSNRHKAPVNVPSLLLVEKPSVEVGSHVSLLAGSAYAKTPTLLEVYHGNELLRRSVLRGGITKQSFPVTQEYRGGLTFVMTTVRDYQLIRQRQYVRVPWTDRNLNVSFSTFRDKLRPGQKETWRVTVSDHKNRPMEAGAVEVLASMFDRSLEMLEKHRIAGVVGLYPSKRLRAHWLSSLGAGAVDTSRMYPEKEYIKPYLSGRMRLVAGGGSYADGAMERRVYARPGVSMAKRVNAPPRATTASPRAAVALEAEKGFDVSAGLPDDDSASVPSLDGIIARENFNETAFFKPHLILEKNGSVTFEFEVPESLTQWQFWVSALTRDLRGGSEKAFTRTSKELMVRPYLPRFLREGDVANIDVLINNSSDKAMSGTMSFDVIDPVTDKSIAAAFKLNPAPRNFKVAAGQSTRQRYSLVAPKALGMVTIRAKARAGSGAQSYGDGEQRPLPVLPSRIHLAQSRFAAVQGHTQRQLRFDELANRQDRTRINDKFVVTVDGQLFYSMLKAVPYLTEYPYECTEQMMNRFLSTSILNRTLAHAPSIKAMAAEFAKRKTKLENWSSIDSDANSKMLLEETPWLAQANGGSDDDTILLKVLDPTVAAAQARQSLQKLMKAQTSDGGFPWWEGGPASPYMTAYLLQGFARAAEFDVQVPKSVVNRSVQYLYQHYLKELKPKLKERRYASLAITLNHALSSFPDSSWYSGTFSNAERVQLLDHSMKEWQTLPLLLKAKLALTLRRMGRAPQAKMVFESLMNGAKSDVDSGVYWPQQPRPWLWYNDRIDTHAFILRTMMEINPQDKRRHGLVQWLMLNKKLNHWNSTRATAESIYALVHYLKREQQLAADERMLVNIGNMPTQEFVFKANQYRGGKQQIMIKGKDITADMATVTLKNDSKPLMFASATWHFSTDVPPASAQGDFFGVTRRFFKRVKRGTEWTLQPLAEGAVLNVGDQLEVQLSLRSKHNAEFVHLRAPRGAGFEPMEATSGYRWQSGVGYYQEIRDSGVNYFLDYLPTGQYTFKYRLRATTSGKFRVAPATVQSVYAPEFNAYSSGTRLSIR